MPPPSYAVISIQMLHNKIYHFCINFENHKLFNTFKMLILHLWTQLVSIYCVIIQVLYATKKRRMKTWNKISLTRWQIARLQKQEETWRIRPRTPQIERWASCLVLWGTVSFWTLCMVMLLCLLLSTLYSMPLKLTLWMNEWYINVLRIWSGIWYNPFTCFQIIAVQKCEVL